MAGGVKISCGISGFGARSSPHTIHAGVMLPRIAARIFYVTLLNACVAFQVGHFFRLTVMRRGYIIVTSLSVAYLAIYTWAMLTTIPS